MEMYTSDNNFFRELKQDKNRFYFEHEGDVKAEIHYVPMGNNRLLVDKTHVDKDYSGIGPELVKKMVDFTREQGKKMDVTCPYAKQEIKKHPEYEDVLSDFA